MPHVHEDRLPRASARSQHHVIQRQAECTSDSVELDRRLAVANCDPDYIAALQAVRVGSCDYFSGGFIGTFLTMFVGATGPFVMMVLRQAGLPHVRLVATHAMAMVIQHGLKVAAFTTLGFAFSEWAPMMAAMIGAGFLGTLAGAKLLNTLPEKTLKKALNIVLTLISVQLIVRALADLL